MWHEFIPNANTKKRLATNIAELWGQSRNIYPTTSKCPFDMLMKTSHYPRSSINNSSNSFSHGYRAFNWALKLVHPDATNFHVSRRNPRKKMALLSHSPSRTYVRKSLKGWRALTGVEALGDGGGVAEEAAAERACEARRERRPLQPRHIRGSAPSRRPAGQHGALLHDAGRPESPGTRRVGRRRGRFWRFPSSSPSRRARSFRFPRPGQRPRAVRFWGALGGDERRRCERDLFSAAASGYWAAWFSGTTQPAFAVSPSDLVPPSTPVYHFIDFAPEHSELT